MSMHDYYSSKSAGAENATVSAVHCVYPAKESDPLSPTLIDEHAGQALFDLIPTNTAG